MEARPAWLSSWERYAPMIWVPSRQRMVSTMVVTT